MWNLNKNNNLINENKELREKVSKLETQKKQKEYADLRNRERIAKHYSEFQRTYARMNNQITKINNENKRLETSLDVLLDRIKPNADHPGSRFDNEIAMLREELAEYRYQLKGAEEENRNNLSWLESKHGGF